MKILLLIVIIFCAWTVTYGQTQVTFQKTYGEGTGNCVQQTKEGGFIIAGTAGGSIITLCKTDSNGTLQWSKSFAAGNSADACYAVQETKDGGFILTGTTTLGAGSYDVLLLKTTSNGTFQWVKSFGGSSDDYGNSVQQTNDSGFIITGKTSSFGAGGYDVYLVKTAADGNLQWAKTYGGTNWESGMSVKQTSDDGFIITGNTNSYGAGTNDVYLIKTAADGTLQWDKTFGGTNVDYGNSVQITNDDGFIITGMTGSFGAGSEDVYLLKTASDGTLLWTKTFGNTGNEWGFSVKQTNDSGFIIVGQTGLNPTGASVYLLKSSSDGTLQWSKTYAGSMYAEIGYCVQQTNDGGYIISGSTVSFASSGSYVYLIKTNSTGNSSCNESSPNTVEGSGGVQGMGGGVQGAGGFVNTPFTQTSFGGNEITLCTTVGINELPRKYLVNISPNPFSSLTTLYTDKILKDAILIIYNAYGQQVKQIKNISGQTITLGRDNLPSGLYFIRLIQENKTFISDKLVITDN